MACCCSACSTVLLPRLKGHYSTLIWSHTLRVSWYNRCDAGTTAIARNRVLVLFLFRHSVRQLLPHSDLVVTTAVAKSYSLPASLYKGLFTSHEPNWTDLNWREQVDPDTRRASASRLYFVLIGCSETRSVSARLVLKTCSPPASLKLRPKALYRCDYYYYDNSYFYTPGSIDLRG